MRVELRFSLQHIFQSAGVHVQEVQPSGEAIARAEAPAVEWEIRGRADSRWQPEKAQVVIVERLLLLGHPIFHD